MTVSGQDMGKKAKRKYRGGQTIHSLQAMVRSFIFNLTAMGGH